MIGRVVPRSRSKLAGMLLANLLNNLEITAAVLHGLYNWLAALQPTFAALVVAASFMLFYAYLSKLRVLTTPVEIPGLSSDEL